MFPVAIALVALGYTVAYWGGSMARAFSVVHRDNLTPESKGGIPFGVLIGIERNPTMGKDQNNLGKGQSFPPFVTGTWGDNGELRPKGEPR